MERIENLSASVIIDQTRLGGNARSTVGTISDMYSSLRLLYSRIGEPYVGTASYFSFNDPNGMCPECAGIGKVMKLDLLPVIAADYLIWIRSGVIIRKENVICCCMAQKSRVVSAL